MVYIETYSDDGFSWNERTGGQGQLSSKPENTSVPVIHANGDGGVETAVVTEEDVDRQIEQELQQIIDSPKHQELVEAAHDKDLIYTILEYSQKVAYHHEVRSSKNKPLREEISDFLKKLYASVFTGLDESRIQVHTRLDKSSYSPTYRKAHRISNDSYVASEHRVHPFGSIFVSAPGISVVLTYKRIGQTEEVEPLCFVDYGFGDVSYRFEHGTGFSSTQELIADLKRSIARRRS